MKYSIKITGSGTSGEIADSLRDIARAIEKYPEEGTYRGSVLSTEINEIREPTEIERENFGQLIRE